MLCNCVVTLQIAARGQRPLCFKADFCHRVQRRGEGWAALQGFAKVFFSELQLTVVLSAQTSVAKGRIRRFVQRVGDRSLKHLLGLLGIAGRT
jgi:hypothetical protein